MTLSSYATAILFVMRGVEYIFFISLGLSVVSSNLKSGLCYVIKKRMLRRPLTFILIIPRWHLNDVWENQSDVQSPNFHEEKQSESKLNFEE